jgi:lysophospholipase L1-like esterase
VASLWKNNFCSGHGLSLALCDDFGKKCPNWKQQFIYLLSILRTTPYRGKVKYIKNLIPFLFALFYFQILYQVTGHPTINYKIFTALSLVLIFIFLIQRGHRKTYAIIFFSGLLFLSIGEVYFRLDYFGIEGIRRFHQYSPAGIRSPIAMLERDDTTYTGLKPGSKGFLAGVPIYVNNLGFIDRDRKFEKKGDVFRIVICGASVSMGQGVEEGKNYPALLEKMLNERIPSRKYEVINLSIAGYGNNEILEVLEKFALKFNPDMIFIAESLQDEQQLLNLRKVPKLIGRDRFLYLLKRPHEKFFFFRAILNDFVPSTRRRIRDIKAEMKEYVRNRLAFNQTRKAEEGQSTKETRIYRQEEVMREYFKKIKYLTHGKKVFILDFRTMRSLHLKAAPNPHMKELSAGFGFGFIHTHDEEYGPLAKDMIIYIGDIHPNSKTQRIYAEAIFKALRPEIESLQN